MKIATWNVNSLTVRLPHVLNWLKTNPVDVLALQETKVIDEKFPFEEIKHAGYHVAFSGQKTYNGVAVLSKIPLSESVTDIPGLDDPQRRILATTVGDYRIVNLYVPNGSDVSSDKFVYKLLWLSKMTAFLQAQLAQFEKVVVVGDFNIAPADVDVHDPDTWVGKVLVSPQERSAFESWLSLGLIDGFRLFDDHDVIYSWWDYRMASFRRNLGLRIDHVLVSPALVKSCQRCFIDKTPRAWERPSDHTPVVAVFSD